MQALAVNEKQPSAIAKRPKSCLSWPAAEGRWPDIRAAERSHLKAKERAMIDKPMQPLTPPPPAI